MKIMKNKIAFLSGAVLYIGLALVLSSYDNVTMHRYINESIVDKFMLLYPNDPDMEDYLFSKSEKVKKPERHKALPDWIVTGKIAVPLTQSFHQQATSTQIHSYIMSMIDGKRTIEDMSVILEKQKLMTKEEAIPAVRSFLMRMFDDSQRSGGF